MTRLSSPSVLRAETRTFARLEPSDKLYIWVSSFRGTMPKGTLRGDGRAPWALPEKYLELSAREQGVTLRNSILRFLRERGPATSAAIGKEIEAPNPDSVKKVLEGLAMTQQVYLEQYPGSNPIFFPNGRLAHPLLQGQVQAGRREYVIRTYVDRLTGRNLTLTEYLVSPSGEKTPRGGIRIDLVDLDALIEELRRISAIAPQSSVVDRGLVTSET